MSFRYPGGLLTTTGPVNAQYPSGVWTQQQSAQYQAQGLFATDPQYRYTTLLLNGNGTNGAQNNTFLDSSTNNFTITRNGNTTQGSFTPYIPNGWWSNFFDAANGNRLTWSFPSSAVQNAVSGTNYTIEFWVFRPPRAGTYQCIFSTENDRNNFLIDSSDNLLITSNGGTSMFTVAANTYIPTNTWTHVALVCSSTTWTLYFNGTSYGTYNSASKTNYATGTAQLGGRNDMNGCGYLSNFRVSTTARYSGAFTPSTAPFTADGSTAMLACQSNRFLDTSTNAQAFTVNGTSSVQAFQPFPRTVAVSAAVTGGSGYFDGSGDYLSLADNTAFVLTGTFTLEAWVYPNRDYSTYQTIITKRAGNTPAAWQLYIEITSGYLGYYNGTGYVSTAKVPLNTWSHVAAVYDGTNINLYLNGVRVLQSATTNADQATGVKIGYHFSSVAEPFQGYMEDVRVVKGVQVYTGTTYTVPSTPLTAISNTSLLCGFTNSGIFDSAISNDLETVGNAQVSTSVVKYGTGSLKFNGGSDVLTFPSNTLFDFGTGDLTIEFWLYVTSTATSYQCACQFGDAATTAGFHILANTNTLCLRTNNGQPLSTTGTITANTWAHVAVTRASGTTRIFIDGITSGGTYSWTASLSSGSTRKIGNDNYTNPLTGYLDEFRITKGYARYTANFTPPIAPFPKQ